MIGVRTTACVLAALLGSAASAQVTQRLSVDSGGVQGNGNSYSPSTSIDGRYVAFHSHASNLVPGDTNGFYDVFVHDRITGATERVSVSTAGVQGNGDSSYGYTPSISSDGRYVAFSSLATNLVSGDTNTFSDVFVRDRQNGTTERVSLDSGGAEGNGDSVAPVISGDGRYVAFESFASNLVAGDTNGTWDVFVRDRLAGTTERASVDSSAAEANGQSHWPAISSDGRYVAFQSYASNLVAGDTNGFADVFVHDRLNGMTERASVYTAGAQANGTTN
jgi:Tol biopolymer transport system component